MEQKHKCYCDLILNSITEGVFTVDLELRITSINRAAEKIMGLSGMDVIGLRLEEALKMETCPIANYLQRSVEIGQETISAHVKLQRTSKRELSVNLNIALLRDMQNTIVGAAATFRDLSAIEGLRRKISEKYNFQDIISKNHEMSKIFDVLPDIAKSDSSVLIEGPSGSGKELFARAIHNLSSRNKHKLVAINCGALPDSLLESELFGYVKGAFTDARTDKPGRFALADKGTIFLDEIGDISPSLQVKFLRVLQEKEYEPLGSTQTVNANVRVVAATNKTLSELVSSGRFREDLYFRLNVVRLSLPPLAHRREDIPLLIELFISHFNILKGKEIEGISERALNCLMHHEFPGNVRELQNIIEHAFILCHDHQIDIEHLPSELSSPSVITQPAAAPVSITNLKQIEEDAIRDALLKNDGHRGKAAIELGIDKSTLWRKMRKYKIQ